MKVAILSPIAWRTPPIKYGPWEQVASNICEGLVTFGIDVTLFATKSSKTNGSLDWVIENPYEEDKSLDPKVAECLHISNVMEKAASFDIIHNHFDFLPLTYSQLIDVPCITTIHGFSSEKIVPVYKKYNATNHYISISNANRHPSLQYLKTIYHGIDLSKFQLQQQKEDYLLFFGRIHPDKGVLDAIKIAMGCNKKLIIAGLIQDQRYFEEVESLIDNDQITYIGNVGPTERNTILGNALALLHPIYFEEPFGLSVVEAMACGTPIIAYNKGSMPEIIDHKKTGFLVHSIPGAIDAIGKLDQISPEYCRVWVEENFSLPIMIKNYITTYIEIIEKKQRSS